MFRSIRTGQQQETIHWNYSVILLSPFHSPLVNLAYVTGAIAPVIKKSNRIKRHNQTLKTKHGIIYSKVAYEFQRSNRLLRRDNCVSKIRKRLGTQSFTTIFRLTVCKICRLQNESTTRYIRVDCYYAIWARQIANLWTNEPLADIRKALTKWNFLQQYSFGCYNVTSWNPSHSELWHSCQSDPFCLELSTPTAPKIYQKHNTIVKYIKCFSPVGRNQGMIWWPFSLSWFYSLTFFDNSVVAIEVGSTISLSRSPLSNFSLPLHFLYYMKCSWLCPGSSGT